MSTGALVDRMNFALSLAANRLPGITVGWAPELDMSALDGDAPGKQVVPTPETEEARLEQMLLPGGVSDATRAAALKEFAAQSGLNATDGDAGCSGAQSESRACRCDRREDQVLAGLLLGSPEFQRRSASSASVSYGSQLLPDCRVRRSSEKMGARGEGRG